MRITNESEFKLFMYFASNKDGYVKQISPAHITQCTGISESSYRRALNGLIQKGFIVKNESINQEADYSFCDYISVSSLEQNSELQKDLDFVKHIQERENARAEERTQCAGETADDEYISQIYELLKRVGIRYDRAKVENQRKKYIREQGCTNKKIYDVLHYWYEIKHNPIAKANGGIGIVPHARNEAEAYYREVEEIKRRNEINRKGTDYNKVAAAVSQLYDTAPKVRPSYKQRQHSNAAQELEEKFASGEIDLSYDN